jgi:hypothetical protein
MSRQCGLRCDSVLPPSFPRCCGLSKAKRQLRLKKKKCSLFIV